MIRLIFTNDTSADKSSRLYFYEIHRRCLKGLSGAERAGVEMSLPTFLVAQVTQF